MKRKLIVIISVVLCAMMLLCTGCGLFDSNTDSLANSSSSGSTKTSDLTQAQLEEALEQYREIAETLTERVATLEEAVQQALIASGRNIGAYATSLADCVMNISCVEEQYNIGCSGTGFVITADGYVITNNHVVYYEQTVYDTSATYRNIFGYYYGTKVVTGVYSGIAGVFDGASMYYNAGGSYELEFVYRDADLDLALLRIKQNAPVGTGWKAIPFYSGEVHRGDELLVLGNAYGFGLSATSGLVSATGKLFADSPKLSFIQTDAAINGGNSGGPAINIYGALIGVVNSKFVSSDVENMGFAIELDKVEQFIANAVKANGITVQYTKVPASAN